MTEDILNVSYSFASEVSESSDNKSDEESENSQNTFDFSFESCFADFKKLSKEKTKTNNAQTTQENSLFTKTRNCLKIEMARYEELTMIKNEENSLHWWAVNKDNFPKMSILVKKYLCAPPSSIQSERLFSIGGTIYSPKRNEIKSETGEILLFLHYNLQMIGFKYS